MKKILCLFLTVLMLFSMTGCTELLGSAYFLFLVATGDDAADKADVFDFVCEKEEALLEAIENGDLSAFENQGFIKKIDADDAGQLGIGEIRAAQEDVDDGHDDIVGQGLGDGGEGGTDDGTNSQCHGVALNGKGHEFIPPGGFDFGHSFLLPFFNYFYCLIRIQEIGLGS